MTVDAGPALLAALAPVEIGRGARSVRIGERVVRLGRHPSLRRLLVALVEASRRGAPLDTMELLACGWPDERLDPRAGANRVYVAIATLRKLGLRDHIVRRGGGYALVGAHTVRTVRE